MKLGAYFMLLSFINVQLFAFVMGWIFLIAQISVTENPADVSNSAFFFGSILASAAIILLVLKYYKGKALFYLLEMGLIFTSFSILASTILDLSYVGASTESINACTSSILCMNLPFIFGLAMVGLRILAKSFRNIFLMFATGIVGALLGVSLDIMPAAILALALAVYDVIAVFYTKHMVTLAKELHDREAGFSITFPSDHKDMVVVTKEKMRKMEKAYKKVNVDAVELGTGDLAIPAMLVVSALKISFWHAMFTMLGATIGISLLFYFIEKKRGYWPALPPLVFFALLLLLIYNSLPLRLP